MSDQRLTEWYDYKGNIMVAAYSDEPTGYNWIDQRTHRLFRQQGSVIQALGLCGRRALEVPGRGEVDCPECLETLSV